MSWFMVICSLAFAEEHAGRGDAHAEDHGGAAGHRAFGIKAVNLTAISDEATAWLGSGFILEAPLSERWVIELAGHGLWGTARAPGFAVPVDVLFKRAWMVDQWVITAGGGPSLTGFWHEQEASLFPGALASAGASWWFHDDGWGLLLETDAGGALEERRLVAEIETALGLVKTF
ncbi:MAG: hypothetical protein AAFV53_04150 [Myxococcota bacterium]